VACRNRSGKTSLTEAQARALADWWGGKYHQVSSSECPGISCHGVIMVPDAVISTSCPRTILSLEEARLLEQVRGHDNPGATDWVG
jgi:hypothetical protein